MGRVNAIIRHLLSQLLFLANSLFVLLNEGHE